MRKPNDLAGAAGVRAVRGSGHRGAGGRAHLVEPLGDPGQQEGRAGRGPEAIRGGASRDKGHAHVLGAGQHVPRAAGRIDRGIRIP